MTESEKFLDKILTYVDDSDKHWFKCHKADIKAYAKIYHKEQLTLYSVVKRTLDQKVVAYDLICKWFAEEYSTDTDRDEVAEMQEQATELNAQIKVLRFIDREISEK